MNWAQQAVVVVVLGALLVFTEGRFEAVFLREVPDVGIEKSARLIGKSGGSLHLADLDSRSDHQEFHTDAFKSAMSQSGLHEYGRGCGHDHGQKQPSDPVDDRAKALCGHAGHGHLPGGCGTPVSPCETHGHERDVDDGALPSGGVILLLQYLGMRELAANLLWLQLDIDSHAGLWHRVYVLLELIPAIDPHFSEAYLLRSFVLNKGFHKIEEAIVVLEEAVRHNPFILDLQVSLGVLCFNHLKQHGPKRYLDKALKAFASALRFPDHLPHIERFYAFTLAALNRRDEGIAYLKERLAQPEMPPEVVEKHRKAILRIEEGEEF
jgi:tetratricopeptide (TPR) repeat protein